MKKLFCVLLFLKLLINISHCENLKYDWPHEVSDLKPDARVVYGKLENGFRYVFMPNKQLPKHFSVRLYVQAGSMMEEEEERGLAHFLEHMAFKGIRGYPEDEMIQTLQRLGVPFGTHSNAHTGIDETVYKLDLMDNNDAYLDHSLRILSGIADGMVLDEALIKKEIGVILAEKRDSDDTFNRLGEDFRNFSYKGLKINERLPIGIESVIKSANSQLLRAFYKKWYRPERMVLVIAGDLNRDEVESQINEYFSIFTGLSKVPSEPDWGALQYDQGLRLRIYKDEELPNTSLALMSLKSYQQKIVSKEERKTEIYQSIAYRILNARMERLAKEENSVFYNAGASSSTSFDRVRQSTITMECEPKQVLQALQVAENELRKVFEFGFTNEEFNRFKSEILYEYKSAIALDETAKTDQLISTLLNTIIDQSVYTSYVFDYKIAKEFLENEANKEACLGIFKDGWDMNNLFIYLSTNSPILYTEAQLKETFNLSKKISLVAPLEEELVKYHYENGVEKGVIVDERYDEKLDSYHYRLSNNIRINLKQTDYDKEKIHYRIDFGNGDDEPGIRPDAIEQVASYILYSGGIGQLSIEKLKRAFAENGIYIPMINVSNDVFTIRESIDLEDFEGQMNLICGYLMEPAYSNEGLKEMHTNLRDSYNNLNKTIGGIMGLHVYPYLTNNHPEYEMWRLEDLIKRTPDEVKNWMKAPLAESYMEITIVGDFKKDEVLESLVKTIGILPKRKESKQCYEGIPEVLLKEGSSKKVFGYYSAIPQAVSMVYWPGPKVTEDNKKLIDRVKTEVLAAVFDERLRQRVRMELGEGYSPTAGIYLGHHIGTQTMTDPDKANYLCELMTQVGASMISEEVTEDEFNRVILAKLLEHKSMKFTNAYWVNLLARRHEFPFAIEDFFFMDNYYQKLTRQEVNEVAKKYLRPEKAVQVIIVPESHRLQVEEISKASI